MNIKKARYAYNAQRNRARYAGIGWEFTFEAWLDWWGEDFHMRGRGAHNLSMQRFHDAGPYAAWNVRKGTPARNSKTAGLRRRTEESLKARARIEAALNAAQVTDSEDFIDEDELEMRKMFGIKSSCKARMIKGRS